MQYLGFSGITMSNNILPILMLTDVLISMPACMFMIS